MITTLSLVNKVSKNSKGNKQVLRSISSQKLILLIGEITSLMMLSKVHRKIQIRDIADIILPQIDLNQFRIYHNSKKEPIALVTWAYFSKKVEKEYLAGKAVLTKEELNSGDIIYLTDFIAPFGHTKQIAKDLKENIFPNQSAKFLRFTEQGKHRVKVREFKGSNV